MVIEFDPLKNAINQSKHGLSLSLAMELEWDDALVRVDSRFDYNETRMVALVPAGRVLYVVVFIERKTRLRIISLRRANRREVKHYGSNNPSEGHRDAHTPGGPEDHTGRP